LRREAYASYIRTHGRENVVGKSGGKWEYERNTLRWEDNIKMALKEIG
jgi:hypothetical protein